MFLRVITLVSLLVAASAEDYEVLLIQYLKNITNYSPLVLPRIASSATKSINISMDIMVSHIVSVETAKQSVKISAYIQASWPEERLVWNPADFGNIMFTRWDATQIWYPIVLIYNGNGEKQNLAPEIPVTLAADSSTRTRVTAIWRREFEFFCKFDMDKFPFDEHDCKLLFFFNDQGFVNSIRPVKSADAMRVTGIYQENNEWILLNATANVENTKYRIVEGNVDTELPTFVLRMKIKRVSTYYFLNIIIPLLLLTLLQVLVYFVPLESGEKLGFGITIMLSYTVFLLLLDGILPKTQNMPAIALFITAAMILSSVSLLLTALTMRFHFTSESTRMPACVRVVFVRFLGRLLCVGGATTSSQVDQKPADGVDGVDGSDWKAGKEVKLFVSEWVVAVRAIERFLLLFGVAATVAIIGIFLMRPYI